MAERDQAQPLSPADTHHVSGSGSDGGTAMQKSKLRRQKLINWCWFVAALTVTLVAVITILILTVFKMKDPEIKINKTSLSRLELVNALTTNPVIRMSLIVDLSVKNPNYVSFKYSNLITTLVFHDKTVGVARSPPGYSKARRSTRMSMTVDVKIDRTVVSPSILADVGSGSLTMNSRSTVIGRINIFGIKKHVVVKMDCTTLVNISTRDIQETKCNRKVDL